MSHLIHSQPVPIALPDTYMPWYDEPVVLRLSAARNHALQTELRCTITGESDAAVQIRIGHRERTISKNLILAVEQFEETPGHPRLQ